MSLLDYVHCSASFPNPRGPLSTRIPSAAIESANPEVCAALNREPPESVRHSRKGNKPRVYSPKEWAEIGKMAVDIGASAAARRFSKKSGYTVNVSMACRFKQLHLEERQAKRLREEEDLTVSTLPLKKKGWPLLLGNWEVRRAGTRIYSKVVGTWLYNSSYCCC